MPGLATTTLGLLWLAATATAPLPPSAQPHCAWLAKEPLSSAESCVERHCHALCDQHPGEYLCSGYKAHVDTADNKYDDPNDPGSLQM